MRSLAFLFLFVFSSSLFAMDYEHGEVIEKNGKQVAWDEVDNKWLSLEEFWRAYAVRNGGLTWGQSTNFPKYSEVKEYDLFMAQLDDGRICLMEFYHERWRRANDVRRWDDKFNEYSACQDIFN